MNMNLYGHRVGLYGKELSSITAGEAEQNSRYLPALRVTTSRRLFFQRPYRRRPPYCLSTFAWRTHTHTLDFLQRISLHFP